MKDLINGFINKLTTFFTLEKSESTKDTACNRLKLVLLHDRAKLDPVNLKKMRLELVDVISKYIVIDKEALELNLADEGEAMALMLNIPVVRAKEPEEIEEALKEAEEKIRNTVIDEEIVSENDEKKESVEEEETEEETDLEFIDVDEITEKSEEITNSDDNHQEVDKEIQDEDEDEENGIEIVHLNEDLNKEAEQEKSEKKKKN